MATFWHYASLWLHDLLVVLGAALAVSVVAGVVNAVTDDPNLHWPSVGGDTALGMIVFPFLCAGGWIVQAIRWHSLGRASVALLAVVPGVFLSIGVIFLCALAVHAVCARVLGQA